MRNIRPSGADTWMRCTGQPALVESLGLQSTDSVYAAEGRAAHELAARCLLADTRASDHIGQILKQKDEVTGQEYKFTVDEDFARAVDDYVEEVTRAAHGADDLLVEQRVDLSKVLQVEDRSGTADAVVLLPKEIQVRDLKFGQGVEVFARRNKQLLLYAAGVWAKHRSTRPELDRLRLVIHQPRIGHTDEYLVSVKGLKKFILIAREKAKEAMTCAPGENLVPGEDQCRWCPAKAQCPALANEVQDAIAGDVAEDGKVDLGDPTESMDSIAELGRKRKLVALVEMWASAVCGLVHDLLVRGINVPGYKLVEGRKGAKAWTDEEATIKYLKDVARIKDADMYNKKLKSPTQMEKVLTENRWLKLQEEGHISQADGKPTVAPDTSAKAAINSDVVFDDVTD